MGKPPSQMGTFEKSIPETPKSNREKEIRVELDTHAANTPKAHAKSTH